MNKKFLMFGIPLLAIALVSAAVGYYVIFSTTFVVNNIDGIGEYSQDLGVVDSEETIVGSSINLLNDLSNDRSLSITDSSDENIDVTYKSTLELTKKNVDFESNVWDVLEGDKVQIEYTVVGDEFTAEVIGEELLGYVLVYYADNDNRFANPGDAVLVEDVTGNLPISEDENVDVYDYCSTGEYLTCHGAKIWYVPSSAIPSGVIDWSKASEFYFESKLIQYNSDGEITFYSGDNLTIIPEYTPNIYADGPYIVTTQIA